MDMYKGTFLACFVVEDGSPGLETVGCEKANLCLCHEWMFYFCDVPYALCHRLCGEVFHVVIISCMDTIRKVIPLSGILMTVINMQKSGWLLFLQYQEISLVGQFLYCPLN
jgi:hypothetical protein